MEETSSTDLSLYRFEYLSDGFRSVDWVWINEDELEKYLDYLSGNSGLIYRKASSDEEELYNEAYNDGYGVATIEEIQKVDNGISYKFNGLLEDGIDTEKMFKCARCDRHKIFETEVAMTGGLYLTESREDILWHVCFDCVMLQSEVDSIDIDHIEKSEDGSGTI